MKLISNFLWSDSKIVLDWIYANPKRYKVFIASRISKINQLVDKSLWSHVRSEDNAADCASKGLMPSELANHSLWWHGPKFLVDESLEQPRYAPEEKNSTVTKTLKSENMQIKCNLTQISPQFNDFQLPDTANSKYPFTALKRVIGYCLRFAHNCRSKQKRNNSLTYNELICAERSIIKIMQSNFYSEEINTLRKNKLVKNSSSLLSLSPFLDEYVIIRVGGRLKRADVPFDAKHQILLPSKHPITLLLIRNIHEECLHGGAKLTESVIRQKYWLPRSQHIIKSVLKNCADCVHANPKPMVQYMGDLPSPRVTAFQEPFSDTAVDYTGAHSCKNDQKSRGKKSKSIYSNICMYGNKSQKLRRKQSTPTAR